jgi:outer membrane translocation and assembly module TamA
MGGADPPADTPGGPARTEGARAGLREGRQHIQALLRTAKFGPIAVLALLCSPAPAVFADLRYEAQIVGVDDSDLADLLDEVSQLKTLEDHLPSSEEALRRRAEDDLNRLKDAAHSLGYWNAQFSYTIDAGPDPAKVIVEANPGPLYRIASIEVRGPDGRPLAVPADPTAPSLPLKPGDPARTASVIATENALLAAFGHASHPFAKSAERQVVVDHDTQAMTVTYTLDPGRQCGSGRRRSAGSSGSIRRMSSVVFVGDRAKATTTARSTRRARR